MSKIATEYELTDLPTCPYCGHEEDQEETHDMEVLKHDHFSDGATQIHSCNNCGEEYKITLSVSFSFYAEKVKEDSSA